MLPLADLVAEAHCHLVIDKIAEVAALVAPELCDVCAVVAGCGCIAGRRAAFIILLVRGIHDLVDIDRAVIIAIVCVYGSVAKLNAALVGNADEHILARASGKAEDIAAVVFIIEIAVIVGNEACNAVLLIAFCVVKLDKLGLADIVGLDLDERNAAGIHIIGAVEIQITGALEICR